MTDYNKYSFKNLLYFLTLEDKYDNEGVDYAEYLLTMFMASSIDDMLTIYNKVFVKIAYYVFCRSLPNYWFITDSWGNKKYLLSELNSCLNENINRWYKSLKNPTKEDCVLCIVNLRESYNRTKFQNEIILHRSFENLHGLDVIGLREKSYNIRRKIRKLVNLDDYLDLRDEYVEVMWELLTYGYRKSVEEEKFEEIRGIDIEKNIKIIRKKKKEKKIKKDVELGISSFNGPINTAGETIFSFILGLPFAFLGAIISNIGKKR